ncbi:BnaC02g41940D [Brassica napus]|uniref:BnaC02g41940D protein n=1 Tax=Brassica napus TaxID=3708 RepID=A0A078ICD8_BRANA|nr:BnaC02g41940D [Brassica napus]
MRSLNARRLYKYGLYQLPPSSPDIFSLLSIYANMDYFFGRKNNIVEPQLDRDPYHWIIWYIWKVRNDKLFRGIDRNPLELVRYAESECQAWFNANERIHASPHVQISKEPQFLSLGNICMVDGSWSFTAQFSGYGWVWKDSHGKI